MERVLEKKELVIYSKAKVACMIGIAFPLMMWVFMLGHIPIIYEKLNLSEIGWGVFLLIFGSTQILTGQICSRLFTPKFGTKLMMLLGILILSISFLIIIFVTNYLIFLIIASLFGISLGLIMLFSNGHNSILTNCRNSTTFNLVIKVNKKKMS